MIVVDASVAVKWFIPEPGEEAAVKLLDGTNGLISPALIRLEVTGAIIRRYREGHLTEKKAREEFARQKRPHLRSSFRKFFKDVGDP
ncbi:MAG TPA: type II toxin-antitoxin system VapC family toxin [Planctomycetaceae bacterium]|jgi:hypothetical protein|nr:type II toxin-antitoxin system VapC family toxin [Planctomycetaceae bacterium]